MNNAVELNLSSFGPSASRFQSLSRLVFARFPHLAHTKYALRVVPPLPTQRLAKLASTVYSPKRVSSATDFTASMDDSTHNVWAMPHDIVLQ